MGSIEQSGYFPIWKLKTGKPHSKQCLLPGPARVGFRKLGPIRMNISLPSLLQTLLPWWWEVPKALANPLTTKVPVLPGRK